jgi:hypothetical protein
MWKSEPRVWEDFIELYRDQPCLWSAKSICYSNKDLKQRSYEKLVEFVQKGIREADMSLWSLKLTILEQISVRNWEKLRALKLQEKEQMKFTNQLYGTTSYFSSFAIQKLLTKVRAMCQTVGTKVATLKKRWAYSYHFI